MSAICTQHGSTIINIYNTKQTPNNTFEITISCNKVFFLRKAYYIKKGIFIIEWGDITWSFYLYKKIHPLLVDIHCHTCTGNYLVYLYINGRTCLSRLYIHQCLKQNGSLTVSFVALKYIKVILYSYLILKKMNERITDS